MTRADRLGNVEHGTACRERAGGAARRDKQLAFKHQRVNRVGVDENLLDARQRSQGCWAADCGIGRYSAPASGFEHLLAQRFFECLSLVHRARLFGTEKYGADGERSLQ